MQKSVIKSTPKSKVKLFHMMEQCEKWIELIKEHSIPKELTALLLNSMIEIILIHAPETNESGEHQQDVLTELQKALRIESDERYLLEVLT